MEETRHGVSDEVLGDFFNMPRVRTCLRLRTPTAFLEILDFELHISLHSTHRCGKGNPNSSTALQKAVRAPPPPSISPFPIPC
jgi:hypothetical protein